MLSGDAGSTDFHVSSSSYSAGNLCLQLLGNLKTNIGAGVGNTNYVRRQELEFSRKDVPRSQLIKEIKEVRTMVETVFSTLTEQQIKKEYPLLVFENKTSTEYILVHLAMHLAYHLGQINYHRRLLDESNGS